MSTIPSSPIFLGDSPATLDDLYRVEGKAELVGGRIIRSMPTGDLPSELALEIAVRLREYARQAGVGIARGDNLGYALPQPLASGRQSFAPDASYYVGPRPENPMRFIDGTPTLAIEVRSERDYSAAAQRESAAKRADYFEAGTLVVWDVDPIGRTIDSYTIESPDEPVRFAVGEVAHAEPHFPGLAIRVSDLFSAG